MPGGCNTPSLDGGHSHDATSTVRYRACRTLNVQNNNLKFVSGLRALAPALMCVLTRHRDLLCAQSGELTCCACLVCAQTLIGSLDRRLAELARAGSARLARRCGPAPRRFHVTAAVLEHCRQQPAPRPSGCRGDSRPLGEHVPTMRVGSRRVALTCEANLARRCGACSG